MLEQPGDCAFAAADRAVEKQHALLDAVALRGALQSVDQVLQWLVEAKHRVATLVVRVVEELVVNPLDAARLFIHGRAGGRDHVIHTLEGIAGDFRLLTDEIEVLLECADPILLTELLKILPLSDKRNNFATVAHIRILPGFRWRWAKTALASLSPAPPQSSTRAAAFCGQPY